MLRRSCMTCGQPELPHPYRHPFRAHHSQAGRHARPYDELVAMLDKLEVRRAERLGVTYAGRHRRDDDG